MSVNLVLVTVFTWIIIAGLRHETEAASNTTSTFWNMLTLFRLYTCTCANILEGQNYPQMCNKPYNFFQALNCAKVNVCQ